jgi:hypothetical protein
MQWWRSAHCLPLDAHPPAAGHADMEAGSLAEVSIMPEGSLFSTGAHDQADRGTRDHALVSPWVVVITLAAALKSWGHGTIWITLAIA